MYNGDIIINFLSIYLHHMVLQLFLHLLNRNIFSMLHTDNNSMNSNRNTSTFYNFILHCHLKSYSVSVCTYKTEYKLTWLLLSGLTHGKVPFLRHSASFLNYYMSRLISNINIQYLFKLCARISVNGISSGVSSVA